jgi:hypothetical protein
MGKTMPIEKQIVISPTDKKLLQGFAFTNSKLALLRKDLSRQEISHTAIHNELQEIMAAYQADFEQAFKPIKPVQDTVFYRHGKIKKKIANFTFHFLNNLLHAFQNKLELAIKAYSQGRREKNKLLQALTSFQKLIAFIEDVYVGKSSSGAKFMDDFNHKLLTINDTSLITMLITDYSLGSKESHVQEFLNKHDLDLVIQNSITALDEVLKNSTAKHLLPSFSPTPKA